jgi:D-alanyl-D-alanine carboxypeptidase
VKAFRRTALRTALAVAAATLAALTGSTPANADVPGAAGTLQNGFQQGLSDGYPGLIGLLRDGSTAQYVSAGKGQVSPAVAADPDAQYRIGSVTKAFTSATVLLLEAEGKLSLDDTVAKWLPNAVNANGWDGSKITVRELLNQTSGLPDYTNAAQIWLPYWLNSTPYAQFDPQTLVNYALGTAAPTTAPGQSWGYSNTNFVLAGMVIKAVTGNDPGTEITHRIITPLGLTNTTFPTTDSTLHGNYLHGYKHSIAILNPVDVTISDTPEFYGTAGAMVSTLADVATFSRALLSGQLLPAQQTAELKTTVNTTQTGVTYGLGVANQQLCGRSTWFHDGGVAGYKNIWMSNDDGTKQAVMAANEFHFDPNTNGQRDTNTALTNAYCAL